MRILWLKTELLHPVDKGGRIRTYQMLRAIAREHHVTYLTLDDGTAAPDALERASEYAQEVVRIPFSPPTKGGAGFFADLLGNAFSALPYAVARYKSVAMRRAIERLAPQHDLVICDFLAPAVNVPHNLSKPCVLFQHNVEAMIWERHAAVSTNPIRKAYMAEQWRRMKQFERDACLRFDHVVAVSPEDANTMRQQYGVTRVSDVPTGVDTEYFTADGEVGTSPYEMVFTGSMDWMPNDDAMIWFVEEILPRIQERQPAATVTIVGRTPSKRLESLASAARGVTVTGRVPDVRPYLERASLFIVPIRIGGGTRLKIFEAMSMGLPVLSTTVGAEGLPVVDGHSAMLRDDADSFARAAVDLFDDSALRHRIAHDGKKLVRERYGWDGVADAFMAICDPVAALEPATR